MNQFSQKTIKELLEHIRQLFYCPDLLSFFFRDKKALIHAITWPAKWMQKNNLHASNKQYKDILIQIFKNITNHADIARAKQYFPAYLLKCIQHHFHHNFDDLYHLLKHIRCSIDRIVMPQAISEKDLHYRNLQNMAAVHDILAQQYRSKNIKKDPQQMTLF